MVRKIEKDLLMQNLCQKLSICDRCSYKNISIKCFDSVNDETSWACGSCPNYFEMRSMGDQLWDPKLEISKILSKGKAMSKQEILFLLDEGVTQRRIQQVVGLDEEAMYLKWQL